MKKILIFIAILIVSSCKKPYEEIVEYDSKGNVKTITYLDKKGNIDSSLCFKNNLIYKVTVINSSKKSFLSSCYTKNRKLKIEGIVENNIKVGKWKFYRENGNLWKIVEFLNICGEEYTNQEFTYDKKGKLIKEKSNFYTYKIEKTKEGIYKLDIFYTPITKKGVVNTINFPDKIEIDKKFCDLQNVKKITLKEFNSKFNISFSILKKKHYAFRGYIEENLFEENSKKEVINHKTKRTYFDILVKDSTKIAKNGKTS